MSSRRSLSTVIRRLAIGSALALGLGLVFGIGLYLIRSQDTARNKLHQDFADRGQFVAGLIGNTLRASDPNFRLYATGGLAGPESGIPAAVDADHPDFNGLVVLRADHSVLGSDPAALRSEVGAIVRSPGFALAVSSGSLTFGDLSPGPKSPSVQSYLPYSTPTGPRVLVFFNPVDQVARLGTAFLSSTVNVAGSRAYIVDGKNDVVASVGGTAAQTTRDRTQIPTLSSASSHASGPDFYVSKAVPATSWRLVLVAPERSLLAPVQSSRRVAWQLFAAFAGAMILLLFIGAASLVGSARLAHARLHDTLTGLPNRALFLERVQQAINEQRSDEPVAALFIDLDGFKPINDTYGHAAGDALLKAVSDRLIESMRPGDYVCRFGGDEFLVLCQRLREPEDAQAVADRIQRYVAEPFEVHGQIVSVGTSIGIALVDAQAHDAELLIHNADLAMYKAKQTGGGRIEQFRPDPTPADA